MGTTFGLNGDIDRKMKSNLAEVNNSKLLKCTIIFSYVKLTSANRFYGDITVRTKTPMFDLGQVIENSQSQADLICGQCMTSPHGQMLLVREGPDNSSLGKQHNMFDSFLRSFHDS